MFNLCLIEAKQESLSKRDKVRAEHTQKKCIISDTYRTRDKECSPAMRCGWEKSPKVNTTHSSGHTSTALGSHHYTWRGTEWEKCHSTGRKLSVALLLRGFIIRLFLLGSFGHLVAVPAWAVGVRLLHLRVELPTAGEVIDRLKREGGLISREVQRQVHYRKTSSNTDHPEQTRGTWHVIPPWSRDKEFILSSQYVKATIGNTSL